LSSEEKKGAYVFQDTTLVVPEGTPDSQIQNEVSDELIDSAFGCVGSAGFVVPDLDSNVKGIRGIILPKGKLPPGWKAVPLRQAVHTITGGAMADSFGPIGRLLRFHHVALWREESRFCGSCGAANKDADNGELARQCTACGRLEFPRISPAVITIVINDRNEALLAHNKKFIPRMYSLIAGFNEPGENLEATVAREIKEEVNIDVEDIRYIRSQPWPFPNSLMLGFSARYKGGELRPDGIEIEDAQWFPRDRLPMLPGHGSVSRYLIELWLNGKLY